MMRMEMKEIRVTSYFRVRKLLTSLTTRRTRHCEGVLPEAIPDSSGEIASSASVSIRKERYSTIGLLAMTWMYNYFNGESLRSTQ